MLQSAGLVPARFLCLTAHLLLLIALLITRQENVLSCLPLDHTIKEFHQKDIELATGLSVAIGLIVVEYIGNVTQPNLT